MGAFFPQGITKITREGAEHHALVDANSCIDWVIGSLGDPARGMHWLPIVPEQRADGGRHRRDHLVPELLSVGGFGVLIQLVPGEQLVSDVVVGDCPGSFDLWGFEFPMHLEVPEPCLDMTGMPLDIRLGLCPAPPLDVDRCRCSFSSAAAESSIQISFVQLYDVGRYTYRRTAVHVRWGAATSGYNLSTFVLGYQETATP